MDQSGVRLLVADADASVRGIVLLCASQEKWGCDAAADGIAALKRLKKAQYDLIILDAELPQINGWMVCRHLRKHMSAPVIFLSANGNEQVRLESFSAGGNDFVTKPFYPRELTARIRNLLQLCGHAAAHEVATAGRLSIDFTAHTAFLDGRALPLAPKEFDLLRFFLKNPGHMYSRDDLLTLVWGQDFFGSDRTVDTHVKNLRQKIAPCQHYIMTVWGYGYKFQPD